MRHAMFLAWPAHLRPTPPSRPPCAACARSAASRAKRSPSRTGITTGSLARIELGQSVPGWDTVRLLVKALDITLAELGKAVEGQSEGKS